MVKDIVSPVANVIAVPLSSLKISVDSYTSCWVPATASLKASIALVTAPFPVPVTASVRVVFVPAVSVVPDTSFISPIVNETPGLIEFILIVPVNTSTFDVLGVYVSTPETVVFLTVYASSPVILDIWSDKDLYVAILLARALYSVTVVVPDVVIPAASSSAFNSLVAVVST